MIVSFQERGKKRGGASCVETQDPEGENSRSMTTRLCRPGAYAVIHTNKVLGNDNRIVPIVQATDQLALHG